MPARRFSFSIVWFVVALFVLSSSAPAQVRIWTDASGKNHIEAELVGVQGDKVTLEKKDGGRIVVPLNKLSESDREFALKTAGVVPPVAAGEAGANAPAFAQVFAIMNEQRRAADVLSLLESFCAAESVPLGERVKAQNLLPEWQRLAARNAVRVGKEWVTPDEFETMKSEERRLIKEAHRLMDVASYQPARDKFLDASKVNPQEVRADFYLGLLNALVANSPQYANRHFNECIRRLTRDTDLLAGTRKANLIAALNNLAIVKVRQGKYEEAVKLWRRAIQLEPYTPELVQNLGRMVRLGELDVVNIGPAANKLAAELYARSTVQFSLARFDANVGWLYIPYIDTFDGSSDVEGDEELIPIGACTGFSVGKNLVLSSRFPFLDADSVTIQGGGPTFSRLKGKVVSVSEHSNLALIRFDGLDAKALPINKARPKSAQDVTIAGYGQPGIGGELQTRVATILNPPDILMLFAGMVNRKVDGNTEITKPVYVDFAYRSKIVHDAITNAGVEGGPLIDSNGTVVGVHIGNRPEFGPGGGSKFSYAEPIEWTVPFLIATGGDFDLREIEHNPNKLLSPNELEELVNGSVFQLVAQKRAPRLEWSHRIEEVHRLQKQGAWTSYEDNTCMACNGKGQVRCRNCVRGFIPEKVREKIGENPINGQEIFKFKTIKHECGKCDADGWIDCPMCDGGVAKTP